MDTFVPKIFDILRFFQISGDLWSHLSTVFKANWTTEKRCLDVIKSTYEENNYIFDPHTAVAKDVADRFANPHRPLIISSTAHYSKFAYDVLKGLSKLPASQGPLDLFGSLNKLGANPSAHANLETVVKRDQKQNTTCLAETSAIMKEIEAFLSR